MVSLGGRISLELVSNYKEVFVFDIDLPLDLDLDLDTIFFFSLFLELFLENNCYILILLKGLSL